MVKVMLCCGAGMSSGFLASSARKVIKKKKMEVSVEARSHSEVMEYMNTIDVLLLGPHYATELDKYSVMAEPYGVSVGVIPQDIYGELNGEKLIELALGLAKKKGEEA